MAKIVIVGPAHPLRGGIATFNERLAIAFMVDGHEVTIFSYSLQYPSLLFPGKTQISDALPPVGVTIRSTINSINPHSWWRTGAEISALEPDIVLVRYWMPFMSPALSTIVSRIKKKTHNSPIILGFIDNALPHERRVGDHFFAQLLFKQLGGFVTMSHKVHTDVASLSSLPVLETPHPLYDNFGERVDRTVALSKLSLPDGVKIFLFFGFIRHYKGLDLLIKALDLLPEDFEDFRLLIAGEFYGGEDEILTLIASSHHAEKIILHSSFIANSQIKYYFSAADAVVQPYRSATQSGVTPLAYHFEVPMIVTDVGGLPDMVPPSLGEVCTPDPSGLAAAMQRILRLDTERFKVAIKDEKSKFQWSTMTDAIVGFAQTLKSKK